MSSATSFSPRRESCYLTSLQDSVDGMRWVIQQQFPYGSISQGYFQQACLLQKSHPPKCRLLSIYRSISQRTGLHFVELHWPSHPMRQPHVGPTEPLMLSGPYILLQMPQAVSGNPPPHITQPKPTEQDKNVHHWAYFQFRSESLQPDELLKFH